MLTALIAATACTRVATTPATRGLHAWTQPDRLRLASTEEPDSLNKLFANSDASDQVANLISAPVFRYDDKGDYVPELALVVPTLANGGISRDGKTIVLHLRHGMHWEDGAPLDARDLRFTWQAVMNPRNNTRLRSGWDDITAIASARRRYGGRALARAIRGDPRHLRARRRRLSAAARAPARGLARSQPRAVQRTAARRADRTCWLRWNHGASLEFDANPRYWRGQPTIAHLTYRIIPNADTLFNAAAHARGRRRRRQHHRNADRAAGEC